MPLEFNFPPELLELVDECGVDEVDRATVYAWFILDKSGQDVQEVQEVGATYLTATAYMVL